MFCISMDCASYNPGDLKFSIISELTLRVKGQNLNSLHEVGWKFSTQYTYYCSKISVKLYPLHPNGTRISGLSNIYLLVDHSNSTVQHC